MSNVLLWLVTVEIIGLAVFPLAYFLLPKLADRGYGLSKPFGILLVGYAAWILSTLHLLPSARFTLIGLVILLAASSGMLAYLRRVELAAFVQRNWKLITITEIVFIAFFLGWTLFRAYDPAIDHTEQPMDFAFLNASIESTFGQPEDPWLRGEPISYYYFGYWMMGALSELSGVASNYSYNLSLALIPALAAAVVLSLVTTMVRADGGFLRPAVVCGVAAGLLLGVVANLEGVLEFMRANAIGAQGFYDWVGIEGLTGPAESPTDSWTPNEFWWWFRATRVINTFVDGTGIDYTIQEFPFFSFILGDLHPHVAAIPFALLAAGFTLNFFRSDLTDIRRMSRWEYGTLAAMAISLGGLAFTNMWDLPTHCALLICAAALKAYPTGSIDSADAEVTGAVIKRIALAVVQVPLLVIGLAILLYLPYYLDFTSSLEGVGAVATPSRYLHLFVFWAVPLVIAAPFIVACFWQTIVEGDWRRMTMVSLLVAFLPFAVWMIVRLQSSTPIDGPLGRFAHTLPLALLIGMGTWSALYETKLRGPTGKGFALALATLGFLLILGPELLYIDDSFSEPSQRMNTVFKLYYQAWVLLAAVGGYSLYYWLSTRPRLTGGARTLSTVWATVTIAFVVSGLYYSAAAATSKSGNFSSDPTLDGISYISTSRPAEYAAIEFIKKNLPKDAAILESVGEWFDAGLISRSTGVPTVFNWPGHQAQWRGSTEKFKDRHLDVTTIYITPDPNEAQILLSKYDVDYVYVGPRELLVHPGPGLDKFPDFMDTVFQQDDVTIYRTRR